ncbi:MAG: methyltransferase domain-containing protein [Myxococcales bacterium]|nr:methyltransferase domain-containing protein [Myxococcales bacterium]
MSGIGVPPVEVARIGRWFARGRCLGTEENSGETYLVARTAPGERVTVKRTMRAGRRYPIADEVIEASPDRVPPMCPHYATCSGCDLLHLREEAAAEVKRSTVVEVLERLAGVPGAEPELVGSEARGDHRVRARLAVVYTTDGSFGAGASAHPTTEGSFGVGGAAYSTTEGNVGVAGSAGATTDGNVGGLRSAHPTPEGNVGGLRSAHPTPEGNVGGRRSAHPTPEGNVSGLDSAHPTPEGNVRGGASVHPTPEGNVRGGGSAFATPDGSGQPPGLGLRRLDGSLGRVADCPASSPRVRAALLWVEGWLSGARRLSLDDVEVIEGVEGVAVVFGGADAAAAAERLGAELASTEASDLGARAHPIVAVASRGDAGVTVARGTWPAQLPVGDISLSTGPGAWVQPSPPRAAALVAWVEDALGAPASVFDATCGTGTLTLALARRGARVLAADASWEAVQSTARAAAAAGYAVETRGGRVQTLAPRLHAAGERFDAVIVNPMREPIGDATMQALGAIARHRVLVLAPAPAAGARDVRALVDAGWEVERIAAVNLHPGTAAVMLGAVLRRR